MTAKTSLKPSLRRSQDKSTPEQERFRYLLAQIEKARKTRAQWEKSVLEFRRQEAEQLQPLRVSLRSTLRDTVFALDRVLEGQRWARIDRDALEGILRGTARTLLDANEDDTEIKAVFDRHSVASFAESKRDELERLKAEAERTMGIDLGDGDVLTEDDLAQRMYEHMAQERKREEERSSRRKSTAQQRVEKGTQAAKQSIREIYRKLASAVHPDREPDAKKRAEKNELMQTINRAYATNDLLTLLEAQMRLEKIDPEHIAKLSGKRLAHYNKLLADQLTSERKTIADLETGFRMDFQLEGDGPITPQNFGRIIKEGGRGIRQEIERQKQFLIVLRTATATKRWLKTQRRFAREWDDEDEEL